MTYKLPEGWKAVRLGDVVKIYNHKRIPLSAKDRSHLEKKYRYYGAQGVIDYVDRYIFDGKYILVAEDGENLRSNKENIARIVNGKFWVNNHAHILQSNNFSNMEYIFYTINELDIRAYLTGSVQPKLNKRNLESIIIPLPPLKEQEAIANTLSALDDKIENNNKIAKNLEAQAQAIFKHWFVDFEFPNEEGKPYKSSGGEMVESELGMIPKGWNTVKLKGELEFLRGVEPGSKNYLDKKEDDNLPFYRVGEMISETDIYVKHDLLKDRVANKDDILVSFDGTVGRVRIGISGGYSTGIRKIFSKGNYFPKTFIYYLFKSKNIQDIIKQHATGTTILHASKSIDYMYIPYNKNIIKKFDGIFNKVFRKLINIQEENKKLEELRDALLPKLISGELRIPLD